MWSLSPCWWVILTPCGKNSQINIFSQHMEVYWQWKARYLCIVQAGVCYVFVHCPGWCLLCIRVFYVVQVGGQFYRQKVGISQGSVLSTLLCSAYYGHMEQHHLRVAPDELLMRQVDDFLLVTPHVQRARQFLELMQTGTDPHNTRTTHTYITQPHNTCTSSGHGNSSCK